MDHALRSTFESCETKFLLRWGCGLKRLDPYAAGGKNFGKAIHIGTEVIDRGGSVDEGIAKLSLDYAPGDDKVRTIDRARDILTLYQSWLRRTGCLFAASNATEVSFQIPLTDHLIHAGRMDGILTTGPLEKKTTWYLYSGNGSPANELNQWVHHNSLIGYAYVCRTALVRLVAMGVYPQPKHGPGIEHLDIPIFDWEFTKWLYDTTTIGENILRLLERDGIDPALSDPWSTLESVLEKNLWLHWTQNHKSCYAFRQRCSFKDLCERGIPRGYIDSYFEINSWKPYQGFPEGEEGE